MKGLCRCVLAVVLGISVGIAEENRPPPPDVDLPFPVGERLTYTIYWGWIAVGESVASTDWVWEEGEWKLRIRFRTRSNSILSSLYPVDDTITTLLNGNTLKPEQFIVDINEGKTERNELTVFDWDAGKAFWTKFHDDKEDEKESIDLAEDTRDLVSFMYFMRRTPFDPGNTYSFEVLTDAKIYKLLVNANALEEIKLDRYGKVKSRRLDPQAKFQGIFVRKGSMRVWVSEDERRIMTKMFIDTPFANVRVLLKSVDGPGEDFWVEKKD